MGEDYNTEYRSEIITNFNTDILKEYFLHYPTVLGSSGVTEIYFEPKKQIVTKIICGE
jgi:hypothetical protein